MEGKLVCREHRLIERENCVRYWNHLGTTLPVPFRYQAARNEIVHPGMLRVQHGMETRHGMDQSRKHVFENDFRHLLFRLCEGCEGCEGVRVVRVVRV